MTRSVRPFGFVGALTFALLVAAAVQTPVSAAPPPHAAGRPSNLGLCSPYLAGLAAPVLAGEQLGGNARSGVNLLIKALGPMLPDHLNSPGELYRIRAHEHPTAPANEECVPRPHTP